MQIPGSYMKLFLVALLLAGLHQHLNSYNNVYDNADVTITLYQECAMLPANASLHSHFSSGHTHVYTQHQL
jgi:hypothetical protein